MNSKSKMILVAGLAVAAASIGIGMTGYAVVAAGNETTVQLAELSPADAIAERQKLMKGNGAAAKTIDAFVESGTGTADDVAKSAASIKEAAGKIPSLFVPGTSIDDNVAKTAAKKEIWDNFDDFKAKAAKLASLAADLEAAAATGDKQKITDAFNTMGKDGCGGCHSLYKQKTQ
ncbi:MAG TPA: cytochrome c [Candidatus Angelobacter sp.]|nr:cytochrome c [Candidatus Angelobacter sp.]